MHLSVFCYKSTFKDRYAQPRYAHIHVQDIIMYIQGVSPSSCLSINIMYKYTYFMSEMKNPVGEEGDETTATVSGK